MTTIEKEKLEIIFHKKYMELAFENGSLKKVSTAVPIHKLEEYKKTWQSYLKFIKCTPRSAHWASMSENYYTKFDFLIKDPSPFNGYIQVPDEETALKILTLGLP